MLLSGMNGIAGPNLTVVACAEAGSSIANANATKAGALATYGLLSLIPCPPNIAICSRDPTGWDCLPGAGARSGQVGQLARPPPGLLESLDYLIARRRLDAVAIGPQHRHRHVADHQKRSGLVGLPGIGLSGHGPS